MGIGKVFLWAGQPRVGEESGLGCIQTAIACSPDSGHCDLSHRDASSEIPVSMTGAYWRARVQIYPCPMKAPVAPNLYWIQNIPAVAESTGKFIPFLCSKGAGQVIGLLTSGLAI